MNKILICRDGIKGNLDGILVNGNKVTFTDSLQYIIEYKDIDEVNYQFIVKNGVEPKVYITSYDGKIKVHNKFLIDDGSLEVYKFYCNQGIEDISEIDLVMPSCKITYYIASIASGLEEYIINVNHKNIDTKSNIINRIVTMDGADVTVVVNSRVGVDDKRSVLTQETRAITFGDSEVRIEPNMYIDCNDVDARHGSIVGVVSEDVLFYLMSRGIDYNACIKLIIRGFLSSFKDIDEVSDIVTKEIDKYWR